MTNPPRYGSEFELEELARRLLDRYPAESYGETSPLDGYGPLPGSEYPPPLPLNPTPPKPAHRPAPHLIQFPFRGMVYDYRTGSLRWEQPGDHLIYRPVSQYTVGEKMVTAFKQSLKHLSPEIQKQLAQLFAPENLPYFVGALALWAGSHFFGVGEVFDAGMMILAVAMFGAQAEQIARDLWTYLDLSINAQSISDLDRAGEHLAKVIAVVGVDVILGLFLKKAKVPKRMNRLAKRIEDAGFPGLNKTLSDIDIPPLSIDDIHADLYHPPGRIRHPVPIVPKEFVHSPNGLRKASRASGIDCGAIAQCQYVAMTEGVYIDVRHAKLSRRLRVLGHPPKPEWMKMKTIDPDDIALGAPAGPPQRVGYFDPSPPPESLKLKDPKRYQRLHERYKMRKKEFNDPDLKRAVNEAVQRGEIQLKDNVVVDAKTGRPFTGDYDLYSTESAPGKHIPASDPLYQRIESLLHGSHFQMQHGPLRHWQPVSTKGQAAKRAMIKSHMEDVPLIQFRPDGSIWRHWAHPLDLYYVD